ncbi:hypothetical protein E2C01_005638 [Portunus trituberculatus]|uniref:Uncharacterized protein n=1 Tax=Portunus trituberculatus TaxID=210409 RepID=A0A5B7CT84_PORTR|nr:hypothetical protein [Portunus trituberculatus]
MCCVAACDSQGTGPGRLSLVGFMSYFSVFLRSYTGSPSVGGGMAWCTGSRTPCPSHITATTTTTTIALQGTPIHPYSLEIGGVTPSFYTVARVRVMALRFRLPSCTKFLSAACDSFPHLQRSPDPQCRYLHGGRKFALGRLATLVHLRHGGLHFPSPSPHHILANPFPCRRAGGSRQEEPLASQYDIACT